MVLLPPCRDAFLASLLLVLFSEARGDCGPPKSFPNARLRQSGGQSYPVGTSLTYTCISGYELVSETQPVTQCLGTEWSEVSVSCLGRRCPFPNIENGRIAGESDLRLGDQITFICDEGYRPVGHNGARCVLRGGSVVWDNEPPHCERIPCRPPPTIANGTHNGQDNYVYGSAVTYRCNNQFSLIGSKTLVCIFDEELNGKWSASAPECKVVRCRIPEVPYGVMKTSFQPSYTYQDRVTFECVSGYRLKENSDISCGANSTWQPRLPECILDIHPTDSTGGDAENGTPTGPTIRSPFGSTVNPMEETTKTEIAASAAKNLSGNDLGHTETPKSPTDESGSSISIGVGAVVGVIAVGAIIVAALICRARHKRQGKTVTVSAPPESYAAVPHNADISLEEQPKL